MRVAPATAAGAAALAPFTPFPPVGMTGDPAVVCAGLEKRYGEGATAVHALRGVDLTVQRGELLASWGRT